MEKLFGKGRRKRLWEVDTTRGIAVVMMVISNFILDLVVFGGYAIEIHSGFWLYFARITAFLFVFIAGISVTLSFSRHKKIKKIVLRGLWIFLWGLAITLATWFLFPENMILFGILHLIGFSIIISPFFLKSKISALVIGFFAIFLGFYLNSINSDANWFFWMGLRQAGYSSFDYTPIFPWFGIFLLGMFLGNMLYPEGKRSYKIQDASEKLFIKFLTLLGRNSLFVYLIHQPLLVGLLLFV